MKAVSDTPIADTSTFMQRRLQLGGLNSFAGAGSWRFSCC